MKKIVQSLKAYVIFSVFLGLIYPLGITLIAQLAMPYKANGSLLTKGGKVIGSSLIGQGFAKPEYFQSRLSAVNYDATNSGATNLGPSSKKLMDATAQNIAKIRKDNALKENAAVPADMALSSASGLDPHISLENALIQAKRISKLRSIPVSILKGVINKNTDPDFIGIWGRPGVNVLTLNRALDEIELKGANEMKILDFLSQEAIILDLQAQEKESAVNEMMGVLAKLKKIKNSAEAIDALMQREKLGSTGIGQGIAIPHSRCDFIKEQMAALSISKKGVEFAALDGAPVHIIFMLLCPGDSKGEHLQAMAKISKILKDKYLRKALMEAKTSQDVLAIIQKADV